MVITIDSGTTNTRIALSENYSVKDVIKIHIGAGLTAESGSNQKLKSGIKNGIDEILSKNDIDISKISAIYASGMLTSELGIYTLEHICVPAGKKELRCSSKTVMINDVADIPITFIPGVKNKFDTSKLSDLQLADVMRGEETELMGIMKLLNINSSFVAILPGTHAKIIDVNQCGMIDKCYTAMSGEILSAISSHTILKNSLPNPLICGNICTDYLEAGYNAAEKSGVNAALFKTRILSNFYGASDKEKAAFFVGSVLYSDISLIKKTAGNNKIVLGGGEPLKSAFAHLLKKYLSNELIIVDDETVKLSTIVGAISIFEN